MFAVNLCLFAQPSHLLFLIAQYADSDCTGTCLKIRTDIRMNMSSLLFFFKPTEVVTFKPEFFKKLTCFTEAVIYFFLSPDHSSPGTEHAFAPRIRRTILAEAGFQVMI